MIKRRYNMPTEGQFIAVWEFCGKIWSGTFKHTKKYLKVYDQETGTWSRNSRGYDYLLEDEDTRFFVL